MSNHTPTHPNDPNLSGLGRALLETGGSKPSGPWVPPTAEELHAILPQYEIVKMLGRGGMGAVYMGRQTSLERPVAIKILSAQLEESDQGFTERFKNEAKAMAKLNHPGIVSVYDFGTTSGGLLYIVMEYVDGTDVARMIAKSGRLHTEHAMAITAHVCDALAYAHERGIIHRDIKPANIMVGYDGAVKVADFGLAKVNTGGKTLGLTMSGMAMGTLHFMAPEALMLGTAVDHRADIYAVGVMLYQMLTGKLPQGMFKMPSLLVPGLDPRYDGIITKAIMEDREARYQGAREMRADLDGILTQPVIKVETPAPASSARAAMLPTQARPQRPGGKPVMRSAAAPSVTAQQQPRRSLAWLWVTALIVAVLGGVAWLVMDTQDKPVVASAPSSPADTTIPSTPPGVSPPAKSTPAPANDTSGWQPLFNGKDLTGWQAHPVNLPVSVAQGMILIRGVDDRKKAGDLFYVGTGRLEDGVPQFKNFEVMTTLKTSKHGNSDLMIHAAPITRTSGLGSGGAGSAGIGVQIWNEQDPGGLTLVENDRHRTGSLWMISPMPTRFFFDDDWFNLKARVEDNRLQVWVRKEGAADWIQTADWTQPANWTPPLNVPQARLGSGTIAFSNWVPAEGEVWIKEVKVRSLDAPTSPTLPDVVAGGVSEPRTLEEALLNYTWEWTHAPLPPDLLTFHSDGTATCPRFSWHWKITGPRTATAYNAQDKGSTPASNWQATLQFDETFRSLTGISNSGRGHYTARRMGPISTSAKILSPETFSSTPPSVETFNGHRYQFVPGALTWKEAKAKAESMGGHLATLTSKEENEWLLLTYRKLLTTQNRNIWLGASEEMAGVGWKWVTGEPFTPLGWFPGEPNGKQGGGGQVGHPFMLNLYSFKDGAVGWNDSSTHFSQSRDNIGFIVEWDADAPSTPVASVSPLTAADDTNGWQSLFNGKDLTGWVLHPTNFPADVQNGLLRLRGSDTIPTSGNMYWRGSGTALPQFTDFEVTATLKTENKGNSGIFLHSHPGASQPNRAEGVEVQIWNDSTRGTTGHTGSLQRVAPLSSSRFRDGDWIQVKARVEGKRVQTWLKKPEETTWLPAIDWTQPDDWAAYPDRPGLRLGSGTISLQNNPPLDGVVWFKEIKFRSLDKSASQPPSVVSATTTAAPVASATLWIDTKSRSLQAKFIRVEGADVVLDIAGKATPVAMASLSAASQQIAQQLQSGVAVATSTGDDFISLLDANQPGDWVQVGPGKLDIQNGVATTSSPSKWGVAIYSKRTFADFILKAEFKGVGPLFNSGLWLRIPDLRNDIERTVANRYEVGIVHSSGDRGRFTGSIWGIHPVRSDGLKANDWNELEVTVTGQLYVVKLNGKLVMNFNGSKSLSGYIGLEENGEPGGGPVQFRNVRIKPLP